MKLRGILLLVFLLSFSPALLAAGAGEHKYTPREQIEFEPSTLAAFDHSGEKVTYRTLADGTEVAEHNGTIGNVTVARLGPDGKIETLCTSDEEAARAFMAGEDIIKNKTLSTVTVRER